MGTGGGLPAELHSVGEGLKLMREGLLEECGMPSELHHGISSCDAPLVRPDSMQRRTLTTL